MRFQGRLTEKSEERNLSTDKISNHMQNEGNCRRLKLVIRCVVFLFTLVILLCGVNGILLKKDSKEKLIPFFQEKENFDVLFFGVSHMQVGVLPMELWKDYGIVSFNFGESGSKLPWSYWALKNALDYTEPSLVVLDVRSVEAEEMAYYSYVRTNFDEFPLSKTKIEAAMDLFTTWEERMSFLIPLLEYHNRWIDLGQEDFQKISTRTDKGARFYYGSNLKVAVPSKYNTLNYEDKLPPGEVGGTYLRKIIELCQNEGIDVILVEIPYPANGKSQRYANGIYDIAAEYDVDYINFLRMDGIVNFNTDMNDSNAHMNDSGSRKVTNYLGKYIQENYNIPDHRQDVAYESWYADYEEFKKDKYDRLREQDRMDVALMLLSDKNLNYSIYIDGKAGVWIDERMLQLVENLSQYQELSLLRQLVGTGQDYYLVVNNGEKCVWESSGGFDQLDAGFATITCGEAEDVPYLTRDEDGSNLFVPVDEAGTKPKVCIIAFDRDTKEIVHAISFEK